MVSEETLKKCLKVWDSPLTGNAVVILKETSVKESKHVRVLVGDLDMGESYEVYLGELKVEIRDAEEADYGYSWTSDHDEDIAEAVVNQETFG